MGRELEAGYPNWGMVYMLYYDHKMLYNSKGGLNCMAINLLTVIQVAYIICTCVASML